MFLLLLIEHIRKNSFVLPPLSPWHRYHHWLHQALPCKWLNATLSIAPSLSEEITYIIRDNYYFRTQHSALLFLLLLRYTLSLLLLFILLPIMKCTTPYHLDHKTQPNLSLRLLVLHESNPLFPLITFQTWSKRTTIIILLLYSEHFTPSFFLPSTYPCPSSPHSFNNENMISL